MIRRVLVLGPVNRLRRGAPGKPSLNRAICPVPETRNQVIYPWAGRSARNSAWRTEPTSVEKLGEDPWGGVKVLSNLEIARSLRNGLRASLGELRQGCRATEFIRGAPSLPGETQLRRPWRLPRESERGGEASRSRGKQPRPPTKAPKRRSVAKEVGPR
jgi:hypothetical protein